MPCGSHLGDENRGKSPAINRPYPKRQQQMLQLFLDIMLSRQSVQTIDLDRFGYYKRVCAMNDKIQIDYVQ